MFKNNDEKGNERKKRPIDELAEETYSWWGRIYVFIRKTRIKSWKAVFAVAFVSGAIVSMVWGISAKVYQSSLAGLNTALILEAPGETIRVGDDFEMDAVIDTDGENIVVVKAIIEYDKEVFELRNIDTSESTFSVGNTCQYNNKACEIITRDDAGGKAIITLSKPSPGIKTDSGIIATLTFRALQESSPGLNNFSFNFISAGRYDDSDMILDDGNGTDTLDSVVGATVAVLPPTCTDFTYSDWGACQPNNTQTRTVVSSQPSGCSGGDPELSRSCTYAAPTCTDFTYSDWGACQPNNTQTRTVVSSQPSGCSGGDWNLSQSCSYVPEEIICESFNYSEWSVCQKNGVSTRFVLSQSPENCSGGNPKTERECTPKDEDDEDAPIVNYKNNPIKIGDEKKKLGESATVYSDSRKISFKGSSENIKGGKVRIYKNGKLEKEIKVGSDSEWKEKIKVKRDDNYEFEVEYLNSRGQQVAKSKKYKVKVDTESPEFTDLPLLLNKKRGDKIWWKAEDDRKIDRFKIEFLGRVKKTKNYSFNVSASAPSGVHILKVSAYDKAGNKTTRIVTIRVR